MALISNFEQAAENAVIFDRRIRDKSSKAFKAFGSFSNWYYFPDLDIFAPNKFIGYTRNLDEDYDSGGHGSTTKTVLAPWFRKLDEGQAEYQGYLVKLNSYAERVGKRINSKTVNHKAIDGGGIFVALQDCPEFSPSDEIDERPMGLIEGAVKSVLVNRFERNPKARAECIRYYGPKCYTCEFDFEEVYGRLGIGFIHVHHLIELSEIRSQYRVNPIEDMRPLCPNCHAMVHKTKPAMHPDELKEYMNVRVSNEN